MNLIRLAPECSQLYHLEPIGKETPYIESLTGLISRLARAHRMEPGQLINHEIAPVVQKDYLNRIAASGGTRFYNHASMLNSTGKASQEFVDALYWLTQRKDLLNCTMYPWHHVFPTRGLVTCTKRWCPVCYQEQLNGNKAVYEQLLWVLQPVTVCPMHKIKLATKCPNCERELRILDRKSQPGYCDRCGCWLGTCDTAELAQASQEEIDYALSAGQIIANTLQASRASKDNVARFLSSSAEQMSGGITELARLVGFPKVTVWGWTQGKNLPPLSSLLTVCVSLGVRPLDVLFGREIVIGLNDRYNIFIEKGSDVSARRVIDFEGVHEALVRYSEVNNTPPLSLREVSRRLDIPRKVLEAHFPEECKAITQRYQSFRKQQANERRECKKQEINDLVETLTSQGVYPSRRKIEELASWRAALRSPELQAEWKSAMVNLSGGGSDAH